MVHQHRHHKLPDPEVSSGPPEPSQQKLKAGPETVQRGQVPDAGVHGEKAVLPGPGQVCGGGCRQCHDAGGGPGRSPLPAASEGET